MIPEKLKQNGQFCVWKYETRDGRKTKVPYNPNDPDRRAETNTPSTFGTYQHAIAAKERTGMDGIGIRIADDIGAIDIDHCIHNGNLSDLAQDVLSIMQCPAEISPGGDGLHLFFQCDPSRINMQDYYINHRQLHMEIYVPGSTNRYLTVTGNHYKGTPSEITEDATDRVQTVLEKHMRKPETITADNQPAQSLLSDEEVIRMASDAKNGAKFRKLWAGDYEGYPSHSEADLALCGILAYWCGRDEDQIDRLFRRSGLMREKWDRRTGNSTYGRDAVHHAARHCASVFSPPPVSSAYDDFSEDDALARLIEMQPWSNNRYSQSDIGNGYLFADYYKDLARYVGERKCWFVFDGVAWRSDDNALLVMELCKKLARLLIRAAAEIPDDNLRGNYLKFLSSWQKRHTRDTILRDASSVYPLKMSAFDQEPYLFNCLNGTLDLRDRSFYAHRPEDYLTKVAGVMYDPMATCPRWEQFISEVMVGNGGPDAEKAQYLQKILGYSLTGLTVYECLFILYGATTRNGKGTACETFLKLMGDYGCTARPETIGMKFQQSSSSPTEDIARLNGKRFVNISEPDKKLTLSAALVKSMTGNDTLNARFLHENSFDFRPQFKLLINTNYQPQVTDITLFTSGRIKVIPFEKHFGDGEQDHGLKQYFAQPENLSGILNWCLDGLELFNAEGLNEPLAVTDAIWAYQQESDKIAQFMDDCLIKDSSAEIRTSELYTLYQSWCTSSGYMPENSRNFCASIKAYGHVRRKRPRGGGNQTTIMIGYRAKGDDDDFLYS